MENVQSMLKEIGKLLKTEREEQGYQQKEVAHKVGLSRQHLSSIEYGKVENYSIRSLILLCNWYDVELSCLIKKSEQHIKQLK